MSASSELLHEQIEKVEGEIAAAQAAGQDASTLIESKKALLKRFQSATAGLTEGRALLKG